MIVYFCQKTAALIWAAQADNIIQTFSCYMPYAHTCIYIYINSHIIWKLTHVGANHTDDDIGRYMKLHVV